MSKYNTFLQVVLLGGTTALPLLALHGGTLLPDLNYEGVVQALQYIVAATTLWSGASYAFLKNAVNILGEDEELKARQGRRGRAIIGVTFTIVVAAAALLATQQKNRHSKLQKEKPSEH